MSSLSFRRHGIAAQGAGRRVDEVYPHPDRERERVQHSGYSTYNIQLINCMFALSDVLC